MQRRISGKQTKVRNHETKRNRSEKTYNKFSVESRKCSLWAMSAIFQVQSKTIVSAQQAFWHFPIQGGPEVISVPTWWNPQHSRSRSSVLWPILCPTSITGETPTIRHNPGRQSNQRSVVESQFFPQDSKLNMLRSILFVWTGFEFETAGFVMNKHKAKESEQEQILAESKTHCAKPTELPSCDK